MAAMVPLIAAAVHADPQSARHWITDAGCLSIRARKDADSRRTVVDLRIACALVSYTTSLLIACTTAATAPATKVARCIDDNGKVIETPTFLRPSGDAKAAPEGPVADDAIPLP